MRTKKAIINSVTSLIYQVISIVSGLIVPRLILAKYGSDCNGIVSSATQLMSIVSLMTIGLTAATRVELYKSLAMSDYYRTGQIIYTTKKYMHKVAYVLALYVLVLAILFPYFSHSSLPRSFITLLVLSVGLSGFIEYYIGIPNRILLQADQKNYIESIFASMGCVLYTSLAVLLIFYDYSLVTVKVTSAFVSLIVMISISLYAKSNYRLKDYTDNISIQLPLRRDAAIHSVANIVHQNSDIVVLTFFTESKIVSVYTVYFFVVGQIKKVMASFTDGLESAFGNMWAKHENDLLRERFSQYEFLIYFIVMVVFGSTASLLVPFISLYTKGVTDINYIRPVLALLMVITEMVYCIRQPYVTIVQAAGKYRDTRNIAIIEAVLNLSISVILVWKLGIIGVVIGTLSANLIRTTYYILFSYNKILGIKIDKVAFRLIWLSLTYIFLLKILSMILKNAVFSTWLSWIAWGIVVFIISILLAVFSSLLFQNDDFLEIIRILKSVVIKR